MSGRAFSGRWLSRYQNESQNAPNEQNASAPNVLPLANSHIPANVADPAVEQGEPEHRLHRRAEHVGVDHGQEERRAGEAGQAERSRVGDGRRRRHWSGKGGCRTGVGGYWTASGWACLLKWPCFMGTPLEECAGCLRAPAPGYLVYYECRHR